MDQFVVICLDNILVFSEKQKVHEQLVLGRLRQNHLYAKPEKCEFSKDATEFLGYIISSKSLTMDPEKVSAITGWSTPKDVKGVQ